MKKKISIIFLVPAAVILLLVVFYPLVYAFWLSLSSYYLGRSPTQFVGLANFVRTIRSEGLLHALRVTVYIAAPAVALELLIGLGIALLLDKINVGRKVFFTFLFLPFTITPVVAGLILRWMFMSRWGMVNYFLSILHVEGPFWFAFPMSALLAVLLGNIWQYTPFVILVLFAGLQTIPVEMIEAARMDGARGFAMLRYIIAPSLKPHIFFVLIMRTMDVFRLFDEVFAMTGGGPGTSTETLAIYNYRLAFKMSRIGEGAAVSVWTLIFLSGIIAVYLYFSYRN